MNRGTTMPCAGRLDELLDLMDGRLAPATAGLLRSHLAACPACQRAHSRLAAIDGAMNQMLDGAMPTPTFDAAVLNRVDALLGAAAGTEARRRQLAEAEHAVALQSLRRAAGRGWRLGALDIVGIASLLWLAGQVLPHVFEAIRGLSPSLGTVPSVPAAALLAATLTLLAVATAIGLGRTQPALLDA